MDNVIEINEIDETLIYHQSTKKYILYLFYRNIHEKPSWIINAYKGIENALKKNSSSASERRPYTLLKNLDLLDLNQDENVKWWEDLKYYSQQINDNKKEIEKKITGDLGEKLSMRYEIKRKCEPKRESLRDEHLGYDIESQESANNKTERLIEVKASKGSFKNAKATISKKQTTMALSSKNYYFHFWDISDEYDPKLAIIDGKKIADQAPKEIKAGKLKEWTYAFKEFRDEFFDPKITI